MDDRQLRRRKPGPSLRLIRWLFPERQIHLRTDGQVSFYRLSRPVQVFLFLVLMAGVGWVTFSTVSFFRHNDVVAAKDNQIASAHLAYRSLLSEIAEYRRRFTAITRDLEENHNLMQAAYQQNENLLKNLKSVESQLKSTEQDREQIIDAREHLKAELSNLQDEMQSLSSRNHGLRNNLDTTEFSLRVALDERNDARLLSDRLREDNNRLKGRLVVLQQSQAELIGRLFDHTGASVESLNKVIELAGLDTEQVLGVLEPAGDGQGGPFIEALPEGMPGEVKASLTNLDARLNQLESLQDVMARMPLVAPLNSYHVTSSFGKRRDPINKRWAMHYGLDLGSPFKSPVYVTAPGTVTFAGWKGKYGKLIEVDHGAGLKTRYGHLHKILVKKGDTLKHRQKIGLVGSTGRSTGAHLHYEVVFKGKPKNPMNFIKAGRYVFKEQ